MILAATLLMAVTAGAPADAGAGAVLPSGTQEQQTPAVRDLPPPGAPKNAPPKTDNGAAPPTPDKTTGAHDLDRGGNPRTQDRSAPAEQQTDVPLRPPVAPPALPKPNQTGGGPDRVNDIH
jgi:hypothetical protein